MDAAAREYQSTQVRIAAGVMASVLRWWRTLAAPSLTSDPAGLYATYRGFVNDARTQSWTAGVEHHTRVRELAEQPGTFRIGARDAGAEERETATSFFANTARVRRELGRGRLDDPAFLAALDNHMDRAGSNLARDGGRLAESGGREALHAARESDRACIGYYRRTDDDPCGFCAMLAGRGLTYTAERNEGRRSRTWLDEQDPEQYHRDCHCVTLPLFVGQKFPPEDRERQRMYARLWRDTPGTGAAQLRSYQELFKERRAANG
ncbi:hypothetical protein ACIP5N_27760 [Streptomyces sp. NPDC088768]|uniref:VG15 protein n=1 Tax=Streptomyces sp. NPDC088768 TaxID=3365894 RepID=UPI0038032CEE